MVMTRRLMLVFAVSGLAACQDRVTTETPSGSGSKAAFDISDATHSNGNPYFFFLPPMVPDPSAQFHAGAFNPSLTPRIEICNLDLPSSADETQVVDGTPCLTTAHGGQSPYALTLTGLVSTTDQIYQSNWKVPTSSDAYYRIRVYVGTIRLGYADVHTVNSGKDLKNVNTGDFVARQDGSALPIKFRIENQALCWPATNCVEKTVNLQTGGTVILTSPNSTTPVAGVQIPAQTTAQTVEVTVKSCDGPDLGSRANGLDLPVFGACFNVTTNPVLTQPLGTPATVFACNIVVNGSIVDPGILALPEAQRELVTMHRFSNGTYQSLPHAPDYCNTTGASNATRSPLQELVRGDWKAAGRQLLELLSPTALHARRRLHNGGGGNTCCFSDFQFALPARMEFEGGSTATGIAGQAIPVVVKVTDLKGGGVRNARVHFSASATPVLTDTAGKAPFSWTLASGSNTLTASGLGIGGDDPNNGPRAGQDPFQPLALHFGDATDGGPVTLATGTRTLTATGQASNCPPSGPCGEAAVNLSEGGRVTLTSGSTVVGGVNIPPQPGQPTVPVTVTPCTGGPLNPRAIDLPVFGNCLTVTTVPGLSLSAPATVYLCGVETDPAVSSLSPDQQHLVTLHRYHAPVVEALPHAADFCPPPVIGQASVRGMVLALVHGDWRSAGRQALGLLGPSVLEARRLHNGGGGNTCCFSDFQFALPAKMEVSAGDNQTGTAGAALPVNPTVLVKDLHNNPVQGATVHFQVQTGGGSPATDVGVLSNSSGLSYTTWTLGTSPGSNTLQASGRGIASTNANGPRDGVDPFIPTDVGLGDASTGTLPVPLGAGTLLFSATGAAAVTGGATPVFTAYGAGGWSYQVGGSAPGGWPGAPSGGSVGSMAFGSSNAGCSLNTAGLNTTWTVGTSLYAWKSITLAQPNAVRIAVAIDNDVQVFVDGIDVSGGLQTHENCPTKGSFVFNTSLGAGPHTLAVLAVDRGGSSYLDVEATGTGGTISSLDLPSSTLTIGGSGVSYTANLYNSTGSAFGSWPSDAVAVQAYVDQGAASRAAGGAIVGGTTGTLASGASTFSFSLSASNSSAGAGTLVAGAATARFELRRGSTVLHTFTLPVTLQ
jgi:hypothetical protein